MSSMSIIPTDKWYVCPLAEGTLTGRDLSMKHGLLQRSHGEAPSRVHEQLVR